MHSGYGDDDDNVGIFCAAPFTLSLDHVGFIFIIRVIILSDLEIFKMIKFI